MTKETIRDTLDARPFKSFSLRLTDGSLISVPHADFLTLTQGGRTAIILGEGEHFSIVDVGLITAIEVGANGK